MALLRFVAGSVAEGTLEYREEEVSDAVFFRFLRQSWKRMSDVCMRLGRCKGRLMNRLSSARGEPQKDKDDDVDIIEKVDEESVSAVRT